MKKLKLLVLKKLFLLASSMLIKAGVMKDQLKWLRHYVAGKGTDIEVPASAIVEAKKTFQRAIVHCWTNGSVGYSDYPYWIGEGSSLKDRDYCVYHSMLYDGIGFGKKPVLFYLVGGFTFHLNEDGTVSGKDVYDWHPDTNGGYFSSPLGNANHKLDWFYKGLDKIFGNDWFSNNNITGVYGISNKLWCDMAEVGAKAFTSYFNDVEVPELLNDEVWASYVSEEDFMDSGINKVSNMKLATLKNAGFIFEDEVVYEDVNGHFYNSSYEYVWTENPRKWSWDKHRFAIEAGLEQELERPRRVRSSERRSRR